MLRLFGKTRRPETPADEQFGADTIQRLLGDRYEAIGRQLSRAGLRAARLDDLTLAQLYHVGWAPEVARAQRLRSELADYPALLVGTEPQTWRRNLSGRDGQGPMGEEHQRVDRASRR